MKFNCAHTKTVGLTHLQPNPKNPNAHPDKQIDMLAKIIDYQGQRSPIVVSNRSGFIVKGHGRLMALQKLGWANAAVDYQDYDNEAQEYADMIADNKIAELADHDDDKMIELIKSTDIDDLELFGLDDFELPKDDAEEREAIEDDVPNVTESISKLGDIYELGEHRLLCGDSTDSDVVAKLMDGVKADMVFTDPPYGMNLDTDYSKMGKTTTTYKEVIGDSKPFDAKSIFKIEAKQYWLWGADYYCDTIPNYKNGSYIVWTKAHSDLENKVFTSRFELVWVYPKTKKEVWFVRSMQHLHGERTGEHPTQKPIELATRAFERKPEYINIVDLFGGSGSTLNSN